MDDPVKIIHKYKNDNGRIQYHVHIYIGDIMNDNCMRVLNKIKNMNLYDSLIGLTDNEQEIITKVYGEFWYEKFFNTYHILFTKDTAMADPVKMRELRTIYDNKWITNHLLKYKERLETVTYNYETAVNEERERKFVKATVQRQQVESEALIDYTTTGTGARSDLTTAATVPDSEVIPSPDEEEPEQNFQGGFDLSTAYPISDFRYEIDRQRQKQVLQRRTRKGLSDRNDYIIPGGADDFGIGDSEVEFDDDAATGEFDFTLDNQDAEAQEFDAGISDDLDGIDLLYRDVPDLDKDLQQTTKEIKKAITSETFDKFKNIADFDRRQDNSLFDQNLKDVFLKNYITHLYIYKDDTIKTIRNKICNGFKNNSKFGNNAYIIPAYQYLWSEYRLKGQYNKVMIGGKWVIRNDIIKIDIEPNPVLRVYEELRGNLKLLRDNIRRQGRIKWEPDDNSILLDYEGYYTCNDLYMIDIYNELGLKFEVNAEELRNLSEVYLRVYFPKIRPDDLRNIIDFLNPAQPESEKKIELAKLKTVFDNINNDLILETEIMRDVELIKKNNSNDYPKIFKENYVTQSFIRVYLLERGKRVNLYRIFNEFLLNEEFPFVQYRPNDSSSRYKFDTKFLMASDKKDIIVKWFENSPMGISFKMRIKEKSDYKYMSINLAENGRIDYKIQWKESDMSTVDDINHTYKYIRRLIDKINAENEKNNFRLEKPTDDKFRFAFINTIQKIELPNKFSINHNDLSEFTRCFYPYVALVIEPRKRKSKLQRESDRAEKSKFGTYLRYKRVSKYENRTKIERRIVHFMRNYEYDSASLANEIGKEFNITDEQAEEEIRLVQEKLPNIKKSRKILKKLENIPKYKPPGIGVDIQGKTRNKYKMRIDGARDREQLKRIIQFMNILIYLYVEIYLYKRGDKQKLKERFKRLTKIAKRRNKVDEIVDHEKSVVRTVKQMAAIDKKRLKHSLDRDQDQWSRDCQNSGLDKRRRPQQFLTAEELAAQGYVWKEKLDGLNFGHYERKIMVDANGRLDSNKKKFEVTLRAIRLYLDDEKREPIYYVCSPEENGKHMFIGFLDKSKNSQDNPRPCCFIKDHLYSKNQEKRNFFLRNIGYDAQETDDATGTIGDQLYILQNSNKIQEKRIAFLPKYLDIFLNTLFNNDRVIHNHYLVSTKSGYYFKYGTRQDEFRYLNALAATINTTVDEIKKRMILALLDDRHKTLFISLNNGDIATQFGTVEAYTEYIQNNEYLEYPLLNDLLSIPGVIDDNGLNIILFQRKIRVIKQSLEKEKIKESYYVVCQNPENIDDLLDPKRKAVVIIKENKNYFPIILIHKPQTSSKDITLTSTFHYDNTDPRNLIAHIFKYYQINCQSDINVLINDPTLVGFNAKATNRILLAIKQRDFAPKYQVIDARNKCKFLITNAGFIIPILRSGIVYNIRLASNLDKYVLDYQSTSRYLREIDKATNSQLRLEPTGIFYAERREKSYLVTAIKTRGLGVIPIIQRSMTRDFIEKEGLEIQNKPNDDLIDAEIAIGAPGAEVDERILRVSQKKFEREMYQQFRFHLSFILNSTVYGKTYKEKLENLIKNPKLDSSVRKQEIKKLLYHVTDNALYKKFLEVVKRNLQQKAGLNPLIEANTPVDIEKDARPSVMVVSDNVIIQKSSDRLEGVDADEFTYQDDVLVNARSFSKNDPPAINKTYLNSDDTRWIHVPSVSREIDWARFVLKNNRELCYYNNDKQSCCQNQHCYWNANKESCILSIREDLLIDYINNVAEELIQNEYKANEIMRVGDYFVSDIVDYNVFTERPNEKIVINNNNNIEKILSEIFGKNNIPRLGKRLSRNEAIQTYLQLNQENPLKITNNWLIQPIIDNNVFFRVFANCYYWMKYPHSDTPIRNLGYYSDRQTQYANYYKYQVINWMNSSENQEEMQELFQDTNPRKIQSFILKLSNSVNTLTNGLVEFYILSRIYSVPIRILDENYKPFYIVRPDKGMVFNHKSDTTVSAKTEAYLDTHVDKIINVRYRYAQDSITPDKVEALYAVKK